MSVPFVHTSACRPSSHRRNFQTGIHDLCPPTLSDQGSGKAEGRQKVVGPLLTDQRGGGPPIRDADMCPEGSGTSDIGSSIRLPAEGGWMITMMGLVDGG
jgi:hypothetical protein